MQNIQVLMADDNREFTALLSEYIEEQGDMEVIGTAYNGEEVLQFIEDGQVPDVLILDIIMPHLDGLGVLEKLRQMDLPTAAEDHHADSFWSRKYYTEGCATGGIILHLEAI